LALSVTILHLSDIHAGAGELIDQDIKDYLPSAERDKMVERLTGYVEGLPKKPDYVVVSGDMTLKGDPKGLDTVSDWLMGMFEGGFLPPVERIIVTPGNHDPTQGIAEGADRDRKRYQNFYRAFGSIFPHAHIPGLDPPLESKNPQFPAGRSFLGGITTTGSGAKTQVASSQPFILDLETDVLIFAFNSSLGCGVYTDPPYFAPLWKFLRQRRDAKPKKAKQITELMRLLRQSTLVDAGLIGREQLKYFNGVMNRMRVELKDHWPKLTKIAVLHHHVSHLWEQQLEVKRFETVVDAHELKQYLIEEEFDLVLHGHKHTNNISLDGSLIPVSKHQVYHPLCIVSGGTVGGPPRTGHRQTFKLIELQGDTGPRSEVVIREVPLKQTAAPSRIIATESEEYRVVLAKH
jgi:3',5'-cyclic AMP phosphodiesterase CpdA